MKDGQDKKSTKAIERPAAKMEPKTHKEIVADYVETSKIASDSARTLAYSTIAVIWILRDPVNKSSAFPIVLIIAGILIILALAFDLAQHVTSSSVALYWLDKARKKQLAANPQTPLPEDAVVYVPWWYEKPSVALYWLKTLSMFLGCGFVLAALIKAFLKS